MAPRRNPAAELAQLDLVFKALGHSARRHILLVMHFRGGDMPAGDIARRFAHSWPTTSRHLKVLTEAGLVEVTQSGRERTYHLHKQRLQEIAGSWLAEFDAPPLVGKAPPAPRPRATCRFDLLLRDRG